MLHRHLLRPEMLHDDSLIGLLEIVHHRGRAGLACVYGTHVEISDGKDAPHARRQTAVDLDVSVLVRVYIFLEHIRVGMMAYGEEKPVDLDIKNLTILPNQTDTSDTGIISKETDRAFHLALAKASGNALYPRIMTMVLSDMEQELWELILSRTIATKRYQDQNNMEHIRICEAVLNGRPDDAHQFMQSHMAMLYERYWSE